MIIGHLVCQDGMPDILRAIESLYCVCDEIYVVDGGSKDGTREFLEDRKKIYNLRVFDRKYDTLGNQRNFLLKQTKKNQWIVTIDQDEKLSIKAQNGLREYILNWISPDIYNDEQRKLPIVIPINHMNLVQDIFHYDGTPVYHNQKAFYYDRTLHWFRDFFCSITYGKDEELVNSLPTVKGFTILHYVRLDPKRLRTRNRHAKKVKYGGYAKDDWTKFKVDIIELPKELEEYVKN